jgi:holo-[acyl-carrier protein] synthase
VIYGVGTDVVEIERGEKLWARFGARAAGKLLMAAELAEFEQARNRGRYLARAFAAKEAFVKALGTGFHGVSYRDAGALRAPEERPRLVFSPAMERMLSQRGIVRSHLSLSDEAGLILAFVVLEH